MEVGARLGTKVLLLVSLRVFAAKDLPQVVTVDAEGHLELFVRMWRTANRLDAVDPNKVGHARAHLFPFEKLERQVFVARFRGAFCLFLKAVIIYVALAYI